MKGIDTYKPLTANDLTPVRLAGTSSYTQGTTVTLDESIANFSQLIFQFGTPSSASTGYESAIAYPWQVNASFTSSNPNIGLSVNGEKVIMTINSNTQITYTSGSIALRCIFGIRK